MGLKQPGHGKVVDPFSASGTPEEVQVLARSLMCRPRDASRQGLPLFMVA
jgi:hypothetical protein